ncbi:hypothetical protein [Elizabethkingia anophelis]|uniref:hypothetical protein n=1 Tax=Elizabethkingia anophelis TaxID=1117645 RepID=UPI000976FEAC|nr:hypothetical protein [Elizabethkingia anophelis]
MKNIRNSIRHVALIGVLCSVLVGINSCSSRENDVPSKEEINGTVLRVNIAGIADNVEVNTSPIASKNNMISNVSSGTSIIATEKMLNLNGFDALVSTEKVNYSNSGLANTAVASSSKLGTTALGLMDIGTKYRLMIYNAADTNHTTPVVNIEATSGTDPVIKIDAGKSYTWYAFSLNETGAVPSVSNGIVAKAGLKNKNIFYANGTLNAQYGENYLNIIFNHNTARINVAIDSRGMFGIMNSNPLKNLNADILKYGDLNVFTGEYSNLVSYSASDITPVNKYNNAVKTYTYFTADKTTAVPAGGLRANIAATGIVKKDPYGGADVTIPIPDNTTIGFNNNAFTLAYNNAYRLNIRLIESGVKVGGITWARSNIGWYTDPVMGTSKNFDPNPRRAYKLNNSSNYYFYWGFPVPDDYCSYVYPQGTWKLPTIEQLEVLKTKSYTIRLIYTSPGSTLATADGVGGYEYDLDPGSVINTAYPEFAQKLFLPIAGTYENNGNSKHAFFIKQTDGQINNLELNLWSIDRSNILQWKSVYNENSSGVITNKSIERFTAPGGPSYNTTIRCIRA